MDAMDFCRFCHANMRVKGNLGGTHKIFDQKKHSNENSVYERLIALGLTLFRSPLISYRMCKTCFRQLGRMEEDISTLRRWRKEDKEKEEQKGDTLTNATSTVAIKTETVVTVEVPVVVSGRLSLPADDSEPACCSSWTDRVPVHNSDTTSPAPKATRTRRLFSKPTTVMPARQHLLEVIIRGKKTLCDNNTAGMVEHITRGNWTTAANLIVRHDKLFGEVKEIVLKVIEDESKTLCNPYNNFILWRSSPDDLRVFSLAHLMSDLQRMSPFLFSIFHRISKQSPNVTCAAAAIALRGREPRLSAFAYYVNNVLLYGGLKKTVFKGLSKLGITTSHGHAIRKQQELAKTCSEEFHLLKAANEFCIDSDSDGNTMDADGAPGGTPLNDTASSRDLVEDIHSLQVSVLSEVTFPEPGINEEQEELLQRTEEPDGSTLTLLAVKSEDENEDLSAHVEVKLESDTEDSDYREESGGGVRSRSSETHIWHICTHCEKGFITEIGLKTHLCVAHVGERRFQCNHCEKRYKHQFDLKVHQHIHTGVKPFQCKRCTMRFPRASALRLHQSIHSYREKPFQCQQCDKSFSTSSYLKFHQRYHAGERPFHCTYCDKRFKQKRELNTHQRIHTGEKPFQCQQCDKSFSTSSYLRVHESYHSKERPFHCTYCDKRFKQKKELNTHQRIHTGEKPFQCKVCDKSFCQLTSLKYHQRCHTGDKPLKRVSAGNFPENQKE